MGEFVGTSGPSGVKGNRGVLGLSLSGYNHFPNWNHAALIYRIGNGDWRYYDEQKKNDLYAQENGYLEFGVNDKILNDNIGSYNVDVTLRK